MGWKDLLQSEPERFVAPWVGGRSLRTVNRTWAIEGRLPAEFGWFTFTTMGRKARVSKACDPEVDNLRDEVRGYLVGDRLVPDGVLNTPTIAQFADASEPVLLIEPGLDRFVRVSAGRPFQDGPLIYRTQEFPQGPEEAVLQAFLDRKTSVEGILGVTPALDVAFRLETWRRTETDRLRAETLARLQAEEEARLRAERLQQVRERIGDGQARRELAAVDFGEAARAALAVGGAEYLDHRASANKNEMIVRFRTENRRFECVCHHLTLAIIDAGICLVNHATGEKGDTRFTLESLPSVIRYAIGERKLVVFRHVDGEQPHHNYDDDEGNDYD